MIGYRGRYFCDFHDLMAKYLDGIREVTVNPVLQQSGVNADMCNADAAIITDCRKEIA
ncbi:hypothetical protein [Parafilimonas terrae]|nr:hypothetical protein [Parafilimonas terrae]